VGQLAMQIADKSSNSFGANTKNNPKEECKAVMTRSKKFVEAEDEESVVYKEQIGEKTGAEVKENDVKGKENQEKGKKIMVQNKEMENQEKEKEGEKEIENEKNEKEEKNKISEKSRSGKALDKGVKVPYPVVPSKKEKDHHLARFLDIFRKLEITMPFGEALQ